MIAIRRMPRTLLLFLILVGMLISLPMAGGPTTATAAATTTEGAGITVHGDWMLEVVNDDGSIAQELAVENALTGVGARQLARLVAGGLSSKGMIVAAVDSPHNIGVECQPGMRAYEGTCFAVCTAEDLTDPDNELCYDGSEPDVDACDGVQCGEGYSCYGGACFSDCTEEETRDPENFLCYIGSDPACDDVQCGEGYFCSGGACFQDCTEEETRDPENFLCYLGSTDVEPPSDFVIDPYEATITLTKTEARAEAWTIYGIESYLACPIAQFTQKALDAPVEVAADQTVNLTVVLSFE